MKRLWVVKWLSAVHLPMEAARAKPGLFFLATSTQTCCSHSFEVQLHAATTHRHLRYQISPPRRTGGTWDGWPSTGVGLPRQSPPRSCQVDRQAFLAWGPRNSFSVYMVIETSAVHHQMQRDDRPSLLDRGAPSVIMVNSRARK